MKYFEYGERLVMFYLTRGAYLSCGLGTAAVSNSNMWLINTPLG